MKLKKVVELILNEISKLKLKDIKIYDLTDKSPIADVFILATADSIIQLEASKNKIMEALHKTKKQLRNPDEPFEGGWLLMDYNDIIVHIMLPEIRSFYNLESIFENCDRNLTNKYTNLLKKSRHK